MHYNVTTILQSGMEFSLVLSVIDKLNSHKRDNKP